MSNLDNLYIQRLEAEEERLSTALQSLEVPQDISSYERMLGICHSLRSLIDRIKGNDCTYYVTAPCATPVDDEPVATEPAEVTESTEPDKSEDSIETEAKTEVEEKTYTLEEVRAITFDIKAKGIEPGPIIRQFAKNLTHLDPAVYGEYIAALRKAEEEANA